MKPLRLALFALALSAAGCKKPCVELAQKMCDCQPTQQDRDSCNSTASARHDQINPSNAEEEQCAELVDKCNCHETNTPEGKRNCGLAR